MASGGDSQTSSTTTAPNSAAVTSTTNKLLNGLSTQYDQGTAVNPVNLFSGAGDTTKQSWATMLGAANNPSYNAGVSGATADFADAAAGNQYSANDPYYKQLSDDTLRDVNATFTGSGRFGSGSHVGEAVKELGNVNNANIAADRDWQMQAAGALPALYSAGMAPGAVQGAVGSAQDANTQGLLQGANDLFRRQNDSGWATLGQASSILGGTAGNAGTTSTSTTPTTPWWQSLIGLGVGLA